MKKLRTVNRKIVSALIFSKDGKLFQGMKEPKNRGVYSDCWHIPGGGIEDGEDEIMALKREVFEETGIDISDEKIELVDDLGKGKSEKTLKNGEKVTCEMKFSVYRVVILKTADKIPVRLNDDLVDYKWVEEADLKNLKITPPSQKLFKRLGIL